MNEEELREQIITIARYSEEMDLILYSQGNFSTRLEGTNHVLITPSGIPYKEMTKDQIVKVSLKGEVIEGDYQPSTEVKIHLATYRTYPQVGGCVHVEPPYINALAVLNKNIPNILGNFVYLFAGKGLGTVPAMRSTTKEFGEATLEAMKGKYGVIWKNHGIFCMGPNLTMAFKRCWVAEQSAKVYYLALVLNDKNPDLIPSNVIDEMVEMAKSFGWI